MDFRARLKLTKHERYYVSIGAVAVILFLVLQLILFPFMGEKGKIKRSIHSKEQILKELISLSSEYMALKENSVDIKKVLSDRPDNFTLFSFLEKQAGRSGIKPSIKYMKPSTSTNKESYSESFVEMKLENVTLEQLVEYLYLVESPENLVGIKRISIKQSRGSPEYLTVLMQLITYIK